LLALFNSLMTSYSLQQSYWRSYRMTDCTHLSATKEKMLRACGARKVIP